MEIRSPVFKNNQNIPSKYTCDGQDVNPALEFLEVPENAKVLVLIMDDPDAPTGTWDQWIVFNIPAGIKEIKENEEPLGGYGKGTSNNLKYKGPCPPDKEHRYFFKLYALDKELDLPEGSTKQEVERAMQGHILESAELIGFYNRS